jgi:hypothetical protein
MNYEELVQKYSDLEQLLSKNIKDFKNVFIIEPEYFRACGIVYTKKVLCIITVSFGSNCYQEIGMILEDHQLCEIQHGLTIREISYYSPLVHNIIKSWLNNFESKCRQTNRCAYIKNELLQQTLKV